MQKYGIVKSMKSTATSSLSTAEKKLLIVFFYYIVLQVIVYIYFSLTQQVGLKLASEIAAYFLCEQNGYNLSNPCSRSGFENLINPGLAVLAFTLTSLAPIVSFVFVVDCSLLKEKINITKTWFNTTMVMSSFAGEDRGN